MTVSPDRDACPPRMSPRAVVIRIGFPGQRYQSAEELAHDAPPLARPPAECELRRPHYAARTFGYTMVEVGNIPKSRLRLPNQSQTLVDLGLTIAHGFG